MKHVPGYRLLSSPAPSTQKWFVGWVAMSAGHYSGVYVTSGWGGTMGAHIPNVEVPGLPGDGMLFPDRSVTDP